MKRRIFLSTGIAACLSGEVLANDWPTAPIRLVVPYAVGGPFDALARMLATAISKEVGQSVLVDFKPGANGAVGVTSVVRATDGHTVLLVAGPPVVQNKLLNKNLAYDPQRDLTPIAKVARSPMMIVANSKVPARSLKELVDYAKANPGKLSAANVGAGSLAQLSELMLEKEAGVDLNLVPYATGQRLTDLLSGEVNMTIDMPGSYMPHVAAGKLRAIAIMGKKRAEFIPGVPSTAELGYPGLVAEAWVGLYGPANFPAANVEKLNAVVTTYLKSPQAREQFPRMLALEPDPSSPEELRQHMASEFAQWGPLIRGANIRLD